MELMNIPCFLCGKEIEVKNTIKGKPYFICDGCGLQVFIRRAKGEERLREWLEDKGEVIKKKSGGVILRLITQLEEVKAKLKEVQDRKGLFPDKDISFIEKALIAEIEGLKEQINKGLKVKNRE